MPKRLYLVIVMGKKNVLIVTDGTIRVKKMAEKIAIALEGNEIFMKEASSFAGNDILPAELIFLGCEEASPPSFDYLEELLQHINLANRPLGIFSPNSKDAIKYLSRIVMDSEAALYREAFLAENSDNIMKWTARVLASK